jgi:rRNA biogenesis protein RRP5
MFVVPDQVLSVDSSRSRITLTLKKTLLDADSSTIVKSFDDAKVGMIVDGVVVKYLPKSILVEYFGGIRALVPMNEMR